MGLLKEILDKIDVHQDPVYLDSAHLIIEDSYKRKNRKPSMRDDMCYDSSNMQINITIVINDDEDE